MNVLKREWFNTTRTDTFTIVPIGDVHIGSRACDEARLRSVVKRIQDDPTSYWVGLGDYCEFINVRDKRFSVAALAPWIKTQDLADLARVQRDRFLDAVRPIASKCLGLVKGNHEETLQQHFERDVYSEIVTGVKEAGKFDADHRLALGFYGWLMLNFYRADSRNRGTKIRFNLHHGFVGGRLAGAKALNMQRWLWTHNADVVIFGHSHNTMIQPEAVEEIDGSGRVRINTRIGCYAGTFHKTNGEGFSTYSEVKGYFPLPQSGVEVYLRPGAERYHERVRVASR